MIFLWSTQKKNLNNDFSNSENPNNSFIEMKIQ